MQDIQQAVVPTLKKYGVKKAAIFGSYSRGEETKTSDVDILIEPPSKMGLFAFTRLKSDLENILQKKVDLVTYQGVSRYLKESIISNQKVIL